MNFSQIGIGGILIGEQIFGEKPLATMRRRYESELEKRLMGEPLPIDRPVDHRSDLTPEIFHRDYFLKSEPVVFKGAAKEWPCCKLWNFDYFNSKCGQDDLLLVKAEGLSDSNSAADYEFLQVQELIENIQNGGEKYLRFSPLVSDGSELSMDLDLNWLDQMRGGRTFARTYYLFIGGKGRRTHLHTDQPCNLYVQAFGRKRWTLFMPSETPYLYPRAGKSAYVHSRVDLNNLNPIELPLVKYAQRRVVELDAGDVLYVPPHVWHYVENLTHTIAVGYRYSSISAALRSSTLFSLLRLMSMNPPIWKTIQYGKEDTNLIWAHSNGSIGEVLKTKRNRQSERLIKPMPEINQSLDNSL